MTPQSPSQLGVCSWSLKPTSPDDLAQRARELELNWVQLALDPIRRGEWSVDATRKALAEANVEVASGMVAFADRSAAQSAQAAHGGFYQALADGTYKKYGLDVTIQPGGPQVNNRPLLPAGRIDFLMTGNLLHNFDNAKNGVPTVVVAAMFQKDPQALMAHPGQGYEKFEALKNAPLALIAKDGQFSWWQWLKVTHGFRDEALKPYNYNLGPFLANPKAIQQGYSVAEPIYVENQGKFKPVVHLIAAIPNGTQAPVGVTASHRVVGSAIELICRPCASSTGKNFWFDSIVVTSASCDSCHRTSGWTPATWYWLPARGSWAGPWTRTADPWPARGPRPATPRTGRRRVPASAAACAPAPET